MSAIVHNFVSLEEILNTFPPAYPLARDVTEWLTSLSKSFQDVIEWELAVEPLMFRRRIHVSVQFAGDETRYNKTFQYSQFEFEKGQ